MITVKEIQTNDNNMSSARSLIAQGRVTIKDGKLADGEYKIKDGTLCRFQKGFLDGNIYDDKGNIIEERAALEYEYGGTEFCKKGNLDGYPAVIQNFGQTEEDWDNGCLQTLRTEIEITEIK